MSRSRLGAPFLGQAPKIVPGILTPSYLPASGKLPDPGPLLRAGLPLAPVIEHGSWRTGQPSIMRYGRDPYRGMLGDAGDGLSQSPEQRELARNVGRVWSILGPISAALSAYHGYRRHRGSIGWAVGWAIMGSLFPVVTPAIAFAQGFGQPMGARR